MLSELEEDVLVAGQTDVSTFTTGTWGKPIRLRNDPKRSLSIWIYFFGFCKNTLISVVVGGGDNG